MLVVQQSRDDSTSTSMDSSRLPLHALLTVSMQISLIKGYVASSAKAQKVEPYSIVHTSPYTSISRDINDIATVGIPRIQKTNPLVVLPILIK